MLFTQLEYFVAVARAEHFGRAAASLYVSQSALSEGIRKLETELGVPLIRRGRTFQGLTPEGELVLKWAQRILSGYRALGDELTDARDRLASHLRFGAIPSGVAHAAALVTAFREAHPLSRASLSSGLTSEQIVAGLRDYELDAGLIHPSAADGPDLLTIPVYEDRAVAVVGAGLPIEQTAITGRRLAELPLCLLDRRMRGRQLLDLASAEHGIVLEPRFEADSVEGLLMLVRTGPWAAVVPESAVRLRGDDPTLRVLPITAPEILMPIMLARLADEPMSPLASAIDAAAARAFGGDSPGPP